MKTYGEIIPDLIINGEEATYPVVNEREIRAAAGIMFLIGVITFFIVIFTKNFILMNIVVLSFWSDFFLKTAISPKYSIFGNIGKILIRKQIPEYVGAIQKRFAWGLGLIMASTMIISTIFLGIRGPFPMLICLFCLTFMWMETSLGICVGCKIYGLLIKNGMLKEPKVRPACPGGVCSIKR